VAANSFYRRRNRSLILIVPVSAFLIFSSFMLARLAADARFAAGRDGRDASVRREAHVAVIFPESQPEFYRRISDGLAEFLEDEGAEFIGFQYMTPFPFMSPEESMLRQSEIASLAEIDGIVIAPAQSSMLAEILSDARRRGIAVVALNNSIGGDSADTVIGVDSFLAGTRVGEISAELLEGPARGYFISGSNSLIPDSDQFMAGLRASIFASGRRIAVSLALLAEDDVFARQRIEEILALVPEISLVIADSPEVTLNLAQAVVENNLVGTVTIIGVAGTPEVDEYFEAGIISRMISINPDEIALKAVQAVRSLLDGGEVDPRLTVNIRIQQRGDQP
jgi:ribose transport system substrate-binding protein